MALYSIEGNVSGIIPDAGKNKSVISGSRVLEMCIRDSIGAG